MNSYTKANRLLKADEFSSVFNFRKVKTGLYVKIHYKPSDLGCSRLGLVVSKKVNKRANKRNYMKRILREWFRCNQSLWSTNVDIVIRVTKYFSKSDYIMISNELKQLTNFFVSYTIQRHQSTV